MTPCLVLDINALEANIRAMSDHCRSHGFALRPHAKTHKCVEIARRLQLAGAAGICVANIGEAEIFAAGGISDILVTSPLVSEAKFERLARLLRQGNRVSIVVDNRDAAKRLGEFADQSELGLDVLLDIDMGRHRTGVGTMEAAIELARFLASHGRLTFAGLQAYAGHLSHVPDHDERLAGGRLAAVRIAEIVASLTADGICVERISGGSTGTLFIDAELKLYTELQYGSYVFMDVEYDAVALDRLGRAPFLPSLFVRTSVISNNWLGMATTDAGFKHFSGNKALPEIVSPKGLGRYEPRSDEHGAVHLSDDRRHLALDEGMECQIPHCDPTVNLYDRYHVVDGEMLVDIWKVDARGAM
ncbi:DSD1 family PLP-dependent enzyme [Chelativorans xinjiangense]|uniref:DSD1 family PLP-dependent enzyme n=1 Tax=Chelativorans xinjiangense TaxID=2681485 RepID=UPI0013570CE7|nr:DSD1 family PLP-dependent enzyme [Chelativorans xinjiangense]